MDFQTQDTPANLSRARHQHRHDMIEKTIWAAFSFVFTMLTFRFLFAVLGANPANGFDAFINGFTSPLVAPFYNLFSYDHPSLGVSVFEGYTLITIAIYGLAAAGLTKLVSISRYPS